ncbi:MAG: hypothetical protein A2Z96_03585 [Spirochaetes bacterium GWB1_48_6]|nr:MAG: hypothetical protein UX15_C0040G0004 [Parcubacteria group bacterium GW2011_GWA1_45_7]KKU10732.1 MAG: hypothetical protein UX14_C0010G0015 [Parcubacteria group bacterium GW2011_GWF1_45_5]OHD12203.1 MAG: hypothetical protein A2Z96_03585 [Spirochaetes bacterium GWB1_48_6]
MALRDFFQELASECQYNEKLQAAILEWAASVPATGTTWDILETQIRYQANQNNTTPEKFVTGLFAQESADFFMMVLQGGGC